MIPDLRRSHTPGYTGRLSSRSQALLPRSLTCSRGRRRAAGTPLLLGVVPWPRGPPPVVQASRQEGAVTGGGGVHVH